MFANYRRAFAVAIALAALFLFLSISTDLSAQPWERVEAGTTMNLNGVFGADSYSLAVGANGTVLRFDGFGWETLDSPTTMELNAVWGSSRTNAYMVGMSGIILRFDGEEAVREGFVTTSNLRGVWGADDFVFAVGDNGTVLQKDEDGWRIVQHVTSRRLRAVVSSGGDAAFAVGDFGTVLRYDGSEWFVEDTPTTNPLFGVWITGPEEAYAVGSFGTVIRYDGEGWELMDTPTTLNLTAVWARSATEVFAVGDFGTVLAFDGAEWARVENVTTLNLNGINNGFIVGDFGTILRNPQPLVESDNLLITEVDPKNDIVEVTNRGPAFSSGELPFCHKNNYASSIRSGTFFDADGILVFEVPNLAASDSDLWLYRNDRFDDPNAMLSGVKWGPKSNVGQTETAVEAGLWPSVDVHAPAPPSRMSLAYDGFGIDAKDWYVDETPSFGEPDVTDPGSVARELDFPRGTQDFEDVPLGDEVFAIEDWTIESDSEEIGIFTARVVPDVEGDIDSRGESTRWLRIRDQDSSEAINVVATPVINSPEFAYLWSFYVYVEELPENGEYNPGFYVQHGLDDGFVSTWGFEIGDDEVCLVVTDAGGYEKERCLAPTDQFVGQWVRLDILVSLLNGFVIGSIDGSLSAQIPIAPAAGVDPSAFRLAYYGSGMGNAATVLLDDVSLEAEDVPIPFGVNAVAAADENNVTVSWSIFGSDDITGFEIHRRVDGGEEHLYAGPLSPNARRFEDNELDRDHTYRYVVCAVRADGSRARSAESSVRIDPRPAVIFGELRAVPSEGRVLLLWDVDVVDRIDGFRIYRRASNSIRDVVVTGGFLVPHDRHYYTDDIETIGKTYYYRIAAVRPNGEEILSASSTASIPAPPVRITGVYPNPFAASTTVALTLSGAGPIDVDVYDVRGKRVATIATRGGVAGRNVIEWNGRDDAGRRVSTGTYFLKVKAGGQTLTRKVVVVR